MNDTHIIYSFGVVLTQMVYCMSTRVHQEKQFWSFLDSLPELGGQLPTTQSSIDRIFKVCSNFSLSHQSLPVLFFYIKTSMQTPINVLLELGESTSVTNSIHSQIQSVADEHSGICVQLEKDGFLLVAPTSYRCETSVSDISSDIFNHLSENIDCNGSTFTLDVSMGVSIFPSHSKNIQELIRFAMLASYSASLDQKPLSIYVKDFDNNAKRKNTILSSMNGTFSGEKRPSGISLHYQPKYSLKSGLIVGFEALCRWQHNDLGAISPAEFIPLIEKTKLIRPLTKLIIEKTIRGIAENLRENIAIPIAVNITTRDLLDLDLAQYICAVLKKHDVPAELLEIEITESSIIENTALAIKQISCLRNLGLSVAIDDFGTGHSSLAYLAHLPVSTIKIDQLFVKDIHNSRTSIIIKSIIELAGEIGIDVIAEGVEDIEALRQLNTFGCPKVQGYFLGKPKPRLAALSDIRKTNTINRS